MKKLPAYYWEGRLSNDKGPAVYLADGTREWYVHGVLRKIDYQP